MITRDKLELRRGSPNLRHDVPDLGRDRIQKRPVNSHDSVCNANANHLRHLHIVAIAGKVATELCAAVDPFGATEHYVLDPRETYEVKDGIPGLHHLVRRPGHLFWGSH